MKKHEAPVVVAQTFDQPVQTVWNAITQIDKMREWYFEDLPDFRAEVGFETAFSVQSGPRTFRHVWRVTRVVPGQTVEYNWKYEGIVGDSSVSFEVLAKNEGTELTVTHRVLESFEDDSPELRRENCLAGWTYFIQERLGRQLLMNT